ncbi:hypothetical protein TSL6_07180 [Sulfurovum sp. TSL6]|uniref:choice-of-anchor F family protein n=1 Tax=Sulfurovum sp. TSL6 TaxID=2826995 RepID=UPI001CC7D8E0|nr:choice-of-anchor F family protein [Sulfurovum sp. TSL6]GIU00212.1 hypothetical protein TSL6_07180 [Sulfurovum sp. TSL6]
MKKNYKNKFLGMSLVTAMLLASNAYAGKIIGANVGDAHVANKQYGFGGWNFSNINVILSDGGDFNTTTGVYDPRIYGDTFYSQVKSTVDNTTVLATVHGKDWPVGEPAGIKVINGDIGQGGKPENCIMTTSYLDEFNTGTGESGYLDTTSADGPVPVICSSPFQTHKRFKVKMLETMIDNNTSVGGYYGNYFDLTFNLEAGDNTTKLYQVLQKINNYTTKRLNGYKIEVLDAKKEKNPNLTLSIAVDTWGEQDFANFAHGLWGPADQHFDTNGFFDDVRAYYPATLSSDKYTISYVGPMQGGNYQTLFGNWLTYKWAPVGIFWDDDKDPSTDNELVAYWGDPLGTGIGWYKGNDTNWEKPTPQELLAWETDPWYEMGVIEDTLNLGLNYIVEVGDNNLIGDTFTIRITPHTDTDQAPPVHYGTTPIVIIPTEKGVVAISPSPTFSPGENLTVSVADTDLNTDVSTEQNITIVVKNSTGDEENVLLVETDVNSSIFKGTLPTDSINVGGVNDGTMTTIDGTIVTAYYIDVSENATITASTTASTSSIVPSDDENPSSGGGGCTYNPNNKGFDMTFLLMMALGLLYPIRRRFIK